MYMYLNLLFLPARSMHTMYSLDYAVERSVRPSVCLSHAALCHNG